MVTPLGSPPVSFLPLHETRSHSRTILVSQLSLLEPLTPTSLAEVHSSIVGTTERPLGPVVAGAAVATGALVTAGTLTAALVAAGAALVAPAVAACVPAGAMS